MRFITSVLIFVLCFIGAFTVIPEAKAVDGEITYTGTNTGLTGDDVGAGPFNLGFTFSYYGTNYTQAYVNINGTITFGSNFAQYSNGALNGAGADNTIYAFWDDLNTNGAQNIYYATVGTAPNRMFVTQWTNIYFHGTSIQMGTFQIILYEGSNDIKLQYRDLLGGDRALGNSATIGIKKNATTYEQYSNNTASLTQGQAILYTTNGANDYNVNASSTYELVYLAPAGAPTSPTLVNPTDGSTGVTLTPTFEWLPVASTTSYTLLISTVANFSSTVVNTAGITGTSYTLGSPLSENTPYYWRVQAVNGFGSSLSPTRSFTTGTTNSAPSTPADVTSAMLMGAATSSSLSGATLSATLSDPDADEQVRYRLQIASDNSFNNLVLDYRSPFLAEGSATFTYGENTGTYLVGNATTTLGAGNYYLRIRAEDDAAASSAWYTASGIAFTIIADTTAPIISSVSVDPEPTSATIFWTTNELSSSRVSYGPSTNYGTTTAETNTSPRVSSHEIELTGLNACITYNFNVRSADASGNVATSTNASFTTKGCTGSAIVTAQTSGAVSTTTGGTVNLTDGASTITLTVPTNYSSSSVNFQIKKIEDDTALAATGLPTGYTAARDHTYALHAVTDSLIPVVTFDEPLTITIVYDNADVQNIDENSLKIYRWDGATWNELTNCSLNAGTNTISCDTDHFSTFTVFGQGTSGGNAGPSGTSVATPTQPVTPQVPSVPPSAPQIPQNPVVPNNQSATTTMIVLPVVPTVNATGTIVQQNNAPLQENGAVPAHCINTYTFTRTLRYGFIGEDVLVLQKFLNCSGFALGVEGPGSPGNETTFFGSATRNALVRFQEAHVQEILAPIGRTTGTGIFAEYSRRFVNGR